MTNVLMIAPINASNFETGTAADGQVLTADGSGGAAFADVPAGLPDFDGDNVGDFLTVVAGGQNDPPIAQWSAIEKVASPGISVNQVLLADGSESSTWGYPSQFNSGGASDGQVLTADGSAGAEWKALEASSISSFVPGGQIDMLISGTGLDVDGLFVLDGLLNDRPLYTRVNGSIEWDIRGKWKIISYLGVVFYEGPEDVATPDLVPFQSWIYRGLLDPPPPLPIVTPFSSEVHFAPSTYALFADGAGGAELREPVPKIPYLGEFDLWSEVEAGFIEMFGRASTRNEMIEALVDGVGYLALRNTDTIKGWLVIAKTT